jgi:BolA protein
LEIIDESHKHAGHAGARDGGGHYVLNIVSAQFSGKNTVARHRMIYSALGELMKREIHALTILARAPDET